MVTNTFPHVIGIASGKGGVGKTTVATHLASAMVSVGKRVLVLDADMGLANAQIAFGTRAKYNIQHVLHGEKSLSDILVQTPQGVWLAPGASGAREMASLDAATTARLIDAFEDISDRFDVLIVDSAAGIASSVMTLLNACQRRVIVVKDEPASIADAYGLIKVMVQEYGLQEIYLLPNMVRSQTHGWQLYKRFNDICVRFLNHSVSYLTAIENDKDICSDYSRYQKVISATQSYAAPRDFVRLADAMNNLAPVSTVTGATQFFVHRMVQTQLAG
jgi:flagellar biosynthesis protein FlhG